MKRTRRTRLFALRMSERETARLANFAARRGLTASAALRILLAEEERRHTVRTQRAAERQKAQETPEHGHVAD